MDETARSEFDAHDRGAMWDAESLPAVAPAVAALTLAAAALTLVAGVWLLRARRTDGARSSFPAPAVHRR